MVPEQNLAATEILDNLAPISQGKINISGSKPANLPPSIMELSDIAACRIHTPIRIIDRSSSSQVVTLQDRHHRGLLRFVGNDIAYSFHGD